MNRRRHIGSHRESQVRACRWPVGVPLVIGVLLVALAGCTTSPPDPVVPVPTTGGPIELATPVLFRPLNGDPSPASTQDCPADRQAGAQDAVTAPDLADETCYPLGPAILEVTELADVRIESQAAGPGLLVTLVEADAETFATYTSGNVAQQVAIVADGAVLSAPIIQGAISGPILITGDFDQAELEQLIETLVGD